MNHIYPLKFTKEAEQDLEDIWVYIANDNISAADQTILNIYLKLENLTTMPMLGRSRQDIKPELRSMTIKTFLVLYMIKDNYVSILRIVRGTRLLSELL